MEGADLGGLVEGSLAALGRSGWQVTCRCTDDQELRRLSWQFTGADRPTDVLAFPLAEGSGGRGPAPGRVLGDVAISIERAVAQASRAGVAAADELRLLAVHGLLHLCGHDHDSAPRAAAMTRATRRLLDADARRCGRPEPPVPDLVPPPDRPS